MGLGHQLRRHPASTKIVENDDTTEVKFEKFADYHDGEPALDEIDIIYYDDNNTKLMAFKNGDIDWCDVSADMLTQYSNDPDVKDCITLYNTWACTLLTSTSRATTSRT